MHRMKSDNNVQVWLPFLQVVELLLLVVYRPPLQTPHQIDSQMTENRQSRLQNRLTVRILARLSCWIEHRLHQPWVDQAWT